MSKYFFCGIGGAGMSSIALYLKKQGHIVCGSDRSFDQGKNAFVKEMLEKAQVQIYPQDGSGICKDIDFFVVTRVVDTSIPEVQKALSLDLCMLKRPQVLARIFHTYTGIAVGGTSGKTTVTAMIHHILYRVGLDPTMINGGISLNTYREELPSNLSYGHGEFCVIEADESDGSIELYHPAVAIVNSLSLDHRSIEENKILFQDFINRATVGAVVNADAQDLQDIDCSKVQVRKFSIQGDKDAFYTASNIRFEKEGMSFTVNDETFFIPMLGAHNVANALSASCACSFFGISLKECMDALCDFKGTKRRMEKLGYVNGILVLDDYAHNPEKMRCAIQGLRLKEGNVHVVYQPHGFVSTRIMKDEIIKMLSEMIDERTFFYVLDIYAGGLGVNDDISTQLLIDEVQSPYKKDHLKHVQDKEELKKWLKEGTVKGDQIVMMGARTEDLSPLGIEIVSFLSSES